MATFDFADNFTQSFNAAKRRQLKKRLQKRRFEQKVDLLNKRMNKERELLNDKQSFQAWENFIGDVRKRGRMRLRNKLNEKPRTDVTVPGVGTVENVTPGQKANVLTGIYGTQMQARGQGGGQSQRDPSRQAEVAARTYASHGSRLPGVPSPGKDESLVDPKRLKETVSGVEQAFKRTVGAVNLLPRVTGENRSDVVSRVRGATQKTTERLKSLRDRLNTEIKARKQRIRAREPQSRKVKSSPMGFMGGGVDSKKDTPPPYQYSESQRGRYGTELSTLLQLRGRVGRLLNAVNKSSQSVPGAQGPSPMTSLRNRVLQEKLFNDQGEIKSSVINDMSPKEVADMLQ